MVITSGSGDIKGYEFSDEVRIKSGSGDIDLSSVYENVDAQGNTVSQNGQP